MEQAPADSQPSALLDTEEMMKKRISEHIKMLRSKGTVPFVTADTGLVPVSDNLSIHEYCLKAYSNH
jgi:hypothetical protein